MVMGEADIGLIPATIPHLTQVVLLYFLGLSVASCHVHKST